MTIERDEIIRNVDRLDSMFVKTAGERDTLMRQVADLGVENTRLAAALAECEGGGPPPPPPPPPTGTLLGISGSTEIAGACQRSFSGGPIGAVLSRPSKAFCPRFHHSWKVVTTGGLISTVSDLSLLRVLANLLPGDEVEVEHETDAKDRKGEGAIMLAARIKAKNDFFDQVVRVRPDLLVVCTLTSFAFEAGLFSNINKYLTKAHVLGADLDGGAFPHNYGEPKRLTNIVSIANRDYNGEWTCPEFGWNNDPQGGRMTVIKNQIADISKFGPNEIQFHNNPSFGATLTPAELAEYSALVATYNG